MFLTRNCATHFAHGPTRLPAAWVHSKAVGSALPWAQGAASHHKHSTTKKEVMLGRCCQCPLCPAPTLLACWATWLLVWVLCQLKQAASSSQPSLSPETAHLDMWAAPGDESLHNLGWASSLLLAGGVSGRIGEAGGQRWLEGLCRAKEFEWNANAILWCSCPVTFPSSPLKRLLPKEEGKAVLHYQI